MSKAVLMSIHPKWCELIASGKKTVEVRKTKPKIETPFKVYIYETKGNKQYYSQPVPIPYYEGKGKVIGEFVCDCFGNYWFSEHDIDIEEYEDVQLSCLSAKEIIEYGDDKPLYFWNISNLVIYDKPKELSEFFVYCDRCDKRPISCKFAYEESNENGYYSECMCDFKRPIERPPQSWCYVEELKEGTEE